MAADIGRDEQKLQLREQGVADAMAKNAAAREGTLGPMEQQISGELGKPAPERPKSDVPTFKPEPIIDPKEYEKLSYGLIAFAMIGGIASKGKWLEVSDALNGALGGYLQGNKEVAAKRYKDYEEGFKSAIAKESQANREFEDVLKNRQLKIQDMISQYRVIAAKYDRQDAMQAAQSRSIDAMWRSVESRKTAMARLEEQHYQTGERLNQQMFIHRENLADRQSARDSKREGGDSLGNFTQDDVKYWAEVVQKGGSLPPRLATTPGGKALTAAVMQQISRGSTSPDDMLSNQADFQGQKAGARTAGTREAQLGFAAHELEQFIPLAKQAGEKVPRTAFKPVNKLIEAGQDQWSPEQAAFVAANRSVINAFSMVASRGAQTVHNVQEAEKMLNTAGSHEVYKATLDQLDKEVKAALKAPGQVREDLRGRRAGDKPAGGKDPSSMSNEELLKALGG